MFRFILFPKRLLASLRISIREIEVMDQLDPGFAWANR